MIDEGTRAELFKGNTGGTVYLPTYEGCFVCGQQHAHGLRTRFFTDMDGTVFAWFEPRDDQTGYPNIVHGGIISALLDEITGWPAAVQSDLVAHTAELAVRFLKPVTLGKKYLASAKIEKGHKRIWEAQGILQDQEGTVYAKAIGKYILASEELTSEVAARMTYRHGDLQAFLKEKTA